MALAVALVTLVAAASLSLLIARQQNPPATNETLASVPDPAAAARVDRDAEAAPGAVAAAPADRDVEGEAAVQQRGRAVYNSSNCARCHSIAGEGNPRNPLDGVGARRTAAELEAWTLGSGAVADSLAPAVLRAKQQYRELSAEDVTALVRYLASLTS
jgi:mono/diheme cytochrome c family protein